MKNYSYLLDKSNISIFYPEYRIKSKKEILKILLEAVRYILITPPTESITDLPHFKLRIDKMSRLFFFTEKKYYSIFFPFTFIVEDGSVSINYKNMIEIDAKLVSHIFSILNDSRFESMLSFDFVEPIYELEFEYNDRLWTLIKDLLMMEDGYIRFDNDPNAFKIAKELNKEHTHPENHLDIFYTNACSFKIGLEKISLTGDFVDYLDVKTDCKYLKSYKG